MRKFILLMTVLMLAPLSTAVAQQSKPTVSPAPSPSPSRLFTTVGVTTTITIKLADGSELKVPVDVLSQPESTYPIPEVSPTPTPVPPRAAPIIKLKPFLHLPFWSKDRPQLEITEGDIYSKKEFDIYGGKYPYHYALDISAPSGTPLFAPCEGYAVRSYHTALAKGVLYQGKTIGFGLGHFVEIQCKTQDSEGKDIEVRVSLGHLREASKDIPIVGWTKDANGLYSPDGIYVQNIDKSKARKVKVGDFIGRVGISGMGWGILESPTDIGTTSWDEHHVHIEVYLRKADGFKDSQFRWDPFGWYASVDKERRYKEFRQSDQGLFLEDNYRQIRFATH